MYKMVLGIWDRIISKCAQGQAYCIGSLGIDQCPAVNTDCPVCFIDKMPVKKLFALFISGPETGCIFSQAQNLCSFGHDFQIIDVIGCG